VVWLFARLLATLPFKILIALRFTLTSFEIVSLSDGPGGETVESDASGKPKPFSSVDERDVKPCF